MISTTRKLSGISMPQAGFKLHETHQSVDVAAVFAVLAGDLAAYRIRNYIPHTECKKIINNFWSSPDKVARYGYGEDGVEGYFLGASHIDKTTTEYLQDAHKFTRAIDDLYEDTINPLTQFRNRLVANTKYKLVRPASSGKLFAGNSKAVYWNDTGDFLLKPHDDIAQLKDPRQKGFEIQMARRVMAVNFYAEVPLHAGQLKLWNIEPDDKSREMLNIAHSGYPYPAEILKELPSMTIPIETADLCVINGNLVHGVMRGNTLASPRNRLLITCFMTSNNKQELIWWT